MTPPKKKKAWPMIAVILAVLILAAAGIYLYAGWIGYQEAPKLIEVQEYRAQLQDPYQLSTAQQDQLFSKGYPEGFTILFYDEETASGDFETVRLESWDYYTQGIGLTFINGELIAEDPIEYTANDQLDPLPYYPEQFSAYMSLEEVIAASGIDSYVEIPLEKEYLEGGVSYFAPALTFGLKDGQLIYIEALALSTP